MSGKAGDPIKYDILVIGTGGGTKLVTPPSKRGFKVAVVEKDRLGGTCLNRGCIPSKMLIYPGLVAETIRESERYFIKNKGYECTPAMWKELVTSTNREIEGDSNSIEPAYEKNPNITLYRGAGKFVGKRELEVNGKTLTADRVLIACGARPLIPPIPGLAGTPFMTSTEALRNTTKPKSIAVIGSGYIATELAFFYGAMGVDMHMIARSIPLRTFTKELADEFRSAWCSRWNVHTYTSVEKVSYDAKKKLFTLEMIKQENKNAPGVRSVLKVESLLVAIGVVPNTDTLDLDKTGVKLDKKGHVIVDKKMATNVSGISAIGDCAGNFMFRHCANYEGEYLLERLLDPKFDEEINHFNVMPYAVFSSPQLAGIGETEEQLVARGAKFVKGVNRYINSAYGMALREDVGLAQCLVEKGSRKLLGFHIVGHEASILIHEVVPLMRLGGKLDDLLYCIHVHPAMSEIVRNAARKARNALMEAGEKLPIRLQIK